MELVATIPPIGNQPGLNAYECAKCGHTDSYFLTPVPRAKGW